MRASIILALGVVLYTAHTHTHTHALGVRGRKKDNPAGVLDEPNSETSGHRDADGAYPYWRLTTTKLGSMGWETYIRELGVWNDRGEKINGSVQWAADPNAAFDFTNALDGDESTHARFPDGKLPVIGDYIAFSCTDTPCSVGKIYLSQNSDYGEPNMIPGWAVQYSKDGETWNTKWTFDTHNAGKYTTCAPGFFADSENNCLRSSDYSFWRLAVSQLGSMGWETYIRELGVWNDKGDDITHQVKWIQNPTAPGFDFTAALDGDEGTHARFTEGKLPAVGDYIAFACSETDTPGGCDVTKIYLSQNDGYGEPNMIPGWAVEHSSDGGATWEAKWMFNTNNAGRYTTCAPGLSLDSENNCVLSADSSASSPSEGSTTPHVLKDTECCFYVDESDLSNPALCSEGGKSEFAGDVNDRAKAVNVGKNCKAIVYSDPGFQGLVDQFDAGIHRLERGGGDAMSSFKCDCRSPTEIAETQRAAAAAVKDGQCCFYVDESDLSNPALCSEGGKSEFVGDINDRAKAVNVGKHCKAVVFSDPGFQGLVDQFDAGLHPLDRQGGDAMSSFKCECSTPTQTTAVLTDALNSVDVPIQPHVFQDDKDHSPPSEPTQLRDGFAIRCHHDDNPAKVYRYENGERRWYPTPDIANSWDAHWQETVTVGCRDIPEGSPMEFKVQQPAESESTSSVAPSTTTAAPTTTGTVQPTTIQTTAAVTTESPNPTTAAPSTEVSATTVETPAVTTVAETATTQSSGDSATTADTTSTEDSASSLGGTWNRVTNFFSSLFSS